MKNIHITRVIIRGFKGFKTTNIDTADITMVKKLQQLISTNGSGKSTFLSELSLTPINKELFRKNGGKEIHFTVDGKNYIFYSTHKEHLLKEVESDSFLTQGTTISHYNELVETMFGYTDYKWKLVTGQLKFSGMTRADRQKWIQTISGIDFAYPFKIYSAIKDEITGVKRSLKEYEMELSNSADTILSNELRNAKVGRVSELNEVITLIIANKEGTPTADAIRQKIARYTELDDKLKIATEDRMRGHEGKFWFLNVDSEEELGALYTRGELEVNELERIFQAKKRELSEKVALRDKLSSDDVFDISAAERMIDAKGAELEELRDLTGSGYLDSHIESLKHIAVNKEQIQSDLAMAIMNRITVGIQHKIPLEKHKEITDKMESLRQQLRDANSELSHTNEMITATMNGKEITCPECNATFKDGARDLGSLNARADELTQRIANITVAGKKLAEMKSDVDAINSDITAMRDILRSNIRHPDVLHDLDKMLDGKHTASDITTRAEELMEIVRTSYRIKLLVLELDELNKTMAFHKQMQDLGGIENFSNQCDHLEQELIDIRNETHKLNKRLDVIKKGHGFLKRYLNQLSDFEKLMEDHSNALHDLRNTLVANATGKLLVDLQSELGRISNELTQDKINMEVRNKLNTMIGNSKSRLKVLIDLEMAINPSTGIIAEQLIAYCRIFSGYTSQILSKIWGYDLVVMEPISHPTRGINYRFPMTVKDDEVISDISCGSTSQRSIIDLAILMASRELLKADGQLLMLDEVGVGFDTHHNLSLGEFLYELVSESSSKNILVIHHDQSIRSSLGDYDTIVFDPTQVVVDDGYNEHVVLKYK